MSPATPVFRGAGSSGVSWSNFSARPPPSCDASGSIGRASCLPKLIFPCRRWRRKPVLARRPISRRCFAPASVNRRASSVARHEASSDGVRSPLGSDAALPCSRGGKSKLTLPGSLRTWRGLKRPPVIPEAVPCLRSSDCYQTATGNPTDFPLCSSRLSRNRRGDSLPTFADTCACEASPHRVAYSRQPRCVCPLETQVLLAFCRFCERVEDWM